MTEEVIETPVSPAVSEAVSSDEQKALKEQLAKMEQKMNFLNEQLMKANSDLAQRDVDLSTYKKEAEQRARDDAWNKQAQKIPEANRTPEMRQLYETDKDAYLDKVVEIMSSTPKEIKANGTVFAVGTEEKPEAVKEDRLSKLGYFIQ
jgi:hypothetical protein